MPAEARGRGLVNTCHHNCLAPGGLWQPVVHVPTRPRGRRWGRWGPRASLRGKLTVKPHGPEPHDAPSWATHSQRGAV